MELCAFVAVSVLNSWERSLGGDELAQQRGPKLVRELLLHLADLACLAVVAQCPGHFLVGHLLAVPLLLTPAVCQNLFVFRRELEDAQVTLHPPHALLHVTTLQELQQELEEAQLPPGT